MRTVKKNLLIDLFILLISVIFAVWLGGSEVFSEFLATTTNSKLLGSLLGGLFFTSIFTAAPSIVILGEMAQIFSPIYVAIIGGIGALIGDLIMFKFLKDRLAKDFYALFHIRMDGKEFRLPRFRWLIVLLAGFIIASPFPDELGLAILGFSNTKTRWVIPISFVFNTLGIWVIVKIVS